MIKNKMFLKYLFLLPILLFPIYIYPQSGERIAVVKSRYDNIELVLSNYNIRYDLIEFRELSDTDNFTK
ncbi:MAG TPA: hypothetical protein PK293_02160, partial [Spirochaetota bacterium]|nr:hypothetical protein [Spirochaetota bacterium]